MGASALASRDDSGPSVAEQRAAERRKLQVRVMAAFADGRERCVADLIEMFGLKGQLQRHRLWVALKRWEVTGALTSRVVPAHELGLNGGPGRRYWRLAEGA